MFLSKICDGFEYSVDLNGKKLMFLSDRNDIPLRVYASENGEFEYAGIAAPSDDGVKLLCDLKETPDFLIVTDGRIQDDYNILCRFVFAEKKHNVLGEIFSADSVVRCIMQYGFFYIFNYGSQRVFAFPTDFGQHPLVHLIPYSYWYKSASGVPEGFCFAAVNKECKICFPDENILAETGAEGLVSLRGKLIE